MIKKAKDSGVTTLANTSAIIYTSNEKLADELDKPIIRKF